MSARAPRRGTAFVLTGPSGVGKSTLLDKLRDALPDRLAYSVSATTRSQRADEVDGIDYHFVSRDEFQRMIEAGAFLEYAEYADNLYGTPLDEIKRKLGPGSRSR